MGNGVNVQVMSIAQKWAGIWGNKQKLDSGYERNQAYQEMAAKGLKLTDADKKALKEMGFDRSILLENKKVRDRFYKNMQAIPSGTQWYTYCDTDSNGKRVRCKETVRKDISGCFLIRTVERSGMSLKQVESIPIYSIPKSN